MKRFLPIISILLAVVTGVLNAQEQWTRINYISGKTIYVAAGKQEGIQVGDTLTVYQNGKPVAKLRVEYVASHSASCRIINAATTLTTGDAVAFIPHPTNQAQTTVSKRAKPRAETPSRSARRSSTRQKSARGVQIRGGLDVNYFQSHATTGSGFTYSRPAIRFRLKAQRLPGGHRFLVSFRSYQIRRQSTLSTLPATENRYRLYTFTLEQTTSEKRLHYQLGRIRAYPISGLGYLDGALLSVRVVQGLRLGVFGGTEPDWETFAFRANAPKYGAYFNYDWRTHQLWLTTTSALITSAVDGVENRTYWYTRQNLRLNNALYVTTSFEMDINRGWRKERTGQSISFTNLFLLFQYRFPGGHAIAFSYDNRRNYWTYFYRTLSDSLFDTRLRQGARIHFTLQLPWHIYVGGYANANFRQGESRQAFAGGFNVMKRQLVFRQASAGLQGHFFRDIFATGGYGRLWVQSGFFSRVYARVALGYRYYTLGGTPRQNQWVRGEIDWQIFSRLSLTTVVEIHNGDDFAGTQQYVSLHYAF